MISIDEKYSKTSTSPTEFLHNFIIKRGCDLCGNPFVDSLEIVNQSSFSVKDRLLYNVCYVCLKNKIIPLIKEGIRND